MRRAALLFALVVCAASCHGKATSSTRDPDIGDTSFASAAPAQQGQGGDGATAGAGAAGGSGSVNQAGPAGTTSAPRTVQETDLYRLEGNRLYYLNGYRGLMVFDVSNVDQPKLLGHSAIYGSPVDMIVENGIATVVVGDWYGQMDDGTPFHGSIVRGLDATDPAHIKVIGEAKLGGWVQDDRVVGHVLYAVSVDYGWSYGWYGSSSTASSVIVSSVSFGGGAVTAVGSAVFPGYTGIFNVTPSSILLAHDSGMQTELRYLDISDPNGAIVQRGSSLVNGSIEGWGADNGRWNLDFADGKTAHVLGCDASAGWCYDSAASLLATVDFSNPDAPVIESQLEIANTGWAPAARFDSGKLYLAPNYQYGANDSSTTPLQVFDLSDPKAPALVGMTSIPGQVWNLLPGPDSTLFALGQDWGDVTQQTSVVSLKYLDVSVASAPKLLSNATFGNGWAWTPAAGTFKAFTLDAGKGLVVLPFSGWDATTQLYNNGLQLIALTPTSATTAGAAHTKGWVERGIFVGTRLVSLSDLSLAVVDYTNPAAPVVTAELTLARNVVAARPAGAHVAEVASDWWDNDVTTSEVRLLPTSNADEAVDMPDAPRVTVDGINARVYANASNPTLFYVVTDVRVATCADSGNWACWARQQQIQVVDVSNGGVRLRGKLQLPADDWGGYGWGWGWFGCFWYDWYDGDAIVQYADDGLAFRRFAPVYSADGSYVIDDKSDLLVADLSDPDSPKQSALAITVADNGWWGNMKMVGSTLYTTHYEWLERTLQDRDLWTVRYYADRIDLSDRQKPRVERRINVPGLVVGGAADDPALLYTIDYRWDPQSGGERDDFDVVRVSGDTATLVGRTRLGGWIGQTFVQGTTAYAAAQRYDGYWGRVDLHAIDLGNPSQPVDRVTSSNGWGWLVGLAGDRAIVQSGWGSAGADIYQLVPGQAPQFRQFVRLRGWSLNGVARQDNQLFLSSGYWGVQSVTLQ